MVLLLRHSAYQVFSPQFPRAQLCVKYVQVLAQHQVIFSRIEARFRSLFVGKINCANPWLEI